MRNDRVTRWPRLRQLYARALPTNHLAATRPSHVIASAGRIGVDLRPYRAASVASHRPQPATHPTRPKLRLFYPVIIGTVLVQLMGLALFGWLLTSPDWTVQSIDIQGTHDPALVATIEALHVTGCNVFRCDLARIEHQVEAIPAVSRATVTAHYPNSLVIAVSERTPALIMQGASVNVLLASDGTVLSTMSGAIPTTNSHVPVVVFHRLVTPWGDCSPRR